jgi:tetratricopeptide (TPR) repeat protein
LRRETADLSDCSLDDAVKLIATDVEDMPKPEDFAEFLKQHDRDEVIHGLSKALRKSLEYPGGVNVLKMMAHLGYDEFIPSILSVFSEEDCYDWVVETAHRTLLTYKDRAVNYFIRHYDELDEEQKISAMSLIKEIGGEKAFEFIDIHFDDLWKTEREFLLYACEAICSETWLDRLISKVNKGQEQIDETYLIISLLNHGKTPEIQNLLEQHYAAEEKREKRISGTDFGDAEDDDDESFINAELRCNSCGEENFYELYRVIVQKKAAPYIAQEITCIDCGKISDFEFTQHGMAAVTAAMMRLSMMASTKTEEEKEEILANSPLIFGQTLAHGKITDIGTAIEKYRNAIEKTPTDPRNYIGLGNIFFSTFEYSKSKACFQKLIEIAPSYIQGYYMLAQIAEEEEEQNAALDMLERGKPYLNLFDCWDTADMTAEDLLESYCDYYNTLAEETKSKRPLLFPSHYRIKPGADKKKIGRNDPCPCGSGKKYKKCCMMKK